MTIAEFAKKFNSTPDTLRYYEKIGLLPHVSRTPSGLRDYKDIDCQRMEFICCMRKAGVSIDALTKYMNLYYLGDETLEARKKILVEQRALLLEKFNALKDSIERLNYKIEHYDDLIFKKESEKL